MQQTNDELWRVQLGTGEIWTTDLEALDRAFDEGLIDARTPVLAPGASHWTTLGEAAGLDEPPARPELTPSLSPLAISTDAPPSRSAPPQEEEASLDAQGELDLDELALGARRRPTIVLGVVASATLALAALAVVVGRDSADPDDAKVDAVQAPPAATALPPPVPEESAPSPTPSQEPEEHRLSDELRQKLLEVDKAQKAREDREDKARAKVKHEGAKAPSPKRAPSSKKSSGPFLNGGDRFDPLNGAL